LKIVFQLRGKLLFYMIWLKSSWRALCRKYQPVNTMLPTLEIDGPVACITLQRPQQANRLQAQDVQALQAHVAQIDCQQAVRVLLLRAQGRYFCSGYDIANIGEIQPEGETGSRFGAMVDAVQACRAVTLAAIHGGVYGGATDMALACDFRLGSDNAEMFMPAARLGLHFYPSGLERFVTRLGLDVTKRLFLTAEKLNAQQMHACGFLTHRVAPQALDATVHALITTLCGMAPLALLGMKRHLNAIAAGRLDSAQIALDVQRSMQSTDLREGQRAWREKRAPVFVGR